jgi:WD40 repeat protein
VSASHDKSLKVWDLASEEELRTLTGHTHKVNAVAVTPDCEASLESSGGGGRRAVSASEDNSLKVWDLASGEVIAGFSAEGMLRACAVAPGGGRAGSGLTIVAGGASGRVHFLRLEGA